MNAIISGIVGLIWVTIAVVILILSFLGGDILAALVFLALVFATPFVLDKTADVL
jgi:hypothetical protein